MSDFLPGDDDEWVIHISGYGTMFFRGNRADAEFFRDGKARWEGGVGYLWRLDDPTFGLGDDGADMVTVFARKSRTAKATTQKLAGQVVTHHNYGRAPNGIQKEQA